MQTCQIPYTRVNKCICIFPKLQGNIPNMRLIMKAKLTTPQKPRHLFGSMCTWQKSRVVEIVRCNLLVMKPLGVKLISWNRHYTELRLPGVGSPCWLGVHHGLPKSVRCDAMTVLVLILMRTASVDEESNHRDRRYCIASDEAAGWKVDILEPLFYGQ